VTRRITENTRYDGLRVDVELDTGWSEQQVHSALREVWADELKRKHDPSKGEDSGPLTHVVTKNERLEKTAFAIQENWTHELADEGTPPQ
jgi:hypothetical protein